MPTAAISTVMNLFRAGFQAPRFITGQNDPRAIQDPIDRITIRDLRECGEGIPKSFTIVDPSIGLVQFGRPGSAWDENGYLLPPSPVRVIERALGVRALPEPLLSSAWLPANRKTPVAAMLAFYSALKAAGARIEHKIHRMQDEEFDQTFGQPRAVFEGEIVRLTIEGQTLFSRGTFDDNYGPWGPARCSLEAAFQREDDLMKLLEQDLSGWDALSEGLRQILTPFVDGTGPVFLEPFTRERAQELRAPWQVVPHPETLIIGVRSNGELPVPPELGMDEEGNLSKTV